MNLNDFFSDETIKILYHSNNTKQIIKNALPESEQDEIRYIFFKEYIEFLFHKENESCKNNNCKHLNKFIIWIRENDNLISSFLSLNFDLKESINSMNLSSKDYLLICKEIDIKTNYLFNYYLSLIKQYKKVFFESGLLSITDPSGKIKEVNDKFCKVSWYEREELVWKPHTVVRHPDTPSETFKELRSLLSQKKSWRGDLKNKNKNWEAYWVRSFIAPILDLKGDAIEYVSVRVDITELQESLKNNKEYKRALNETSMVLYLDDKFIIKHSNKLFKKTFQQDESLGLFIKEKPFININSYNETCLDLFMCSEGVFLNDKKVLESLLKELEFEKISKQMLKLKDKNNEIIWCYTIALKLENADGKTSGYMIIFQDVTDIENAKLQVEKTLEKLKDLNQKKDDFINVASHELRTPITVINWYSEMILDFYPELDQPIRDNIEIIQRNSKYMTNLIKDMLDVAKLESHKMNINRVPFKLSSFLDKIKYSFEKIAKDKKLYINTLYEFDGNYEICSDELLLNKVLFNLMHNAFKFTDVWWVTLSILKYGEDKLIFSVKDTWIWISKESHSLIFEKFWQVKTKLDRELEGTWLGLSIVKWIVEALGWEINLESDIWKWAEFKIILPIIC